MEITSKGFYIKHLSAFRVPLARWCSRNLQTRGRYGGGGMEMGMVKSKVKKMRNDKLDLLRLGNLKRIQDQFN